jgi:valyl-tRNA synthetase
MNKAEQRFPDKKGKIELYHDEDVLDTWFSSGIFPFSICEWPENTSDMQKYYPGTLLETGHDVIYLFYFLILL